MCCSGFVLCRSAQRSRSCFAFYMISSIQRIEIISLKLGRITGLADADPLEKMMEAYQRVGRPMVGMIEIQYGLERVPGLREINRVSHLRRPNSDSATHQSIAATRIRFARANLPQALGTHSFCSQPWLPHNSANLFRSLEASQPEGSSIMWIVDWKTVYGLR